MTSKCPLCYTAIEARELKSCQLVPMAIPKEGDPIELHLVTRIKNSTILQDEATREKGKLTRLPYLYYSGVIPFTRVVMIYDIDLIVEVERKQLTEALWLANSCQDLHLVPFLREGLKELERRENDFKKLFAKVKPGTKSCITRYRAAKSI